MFLHDIFVFALISVYFIDVFLLFIYGVHLYVMIYLYKKNKHKCISNLEKPPIDLEKTDLNQIPEVAIQLPIYNEYYVVDRLLDSIRNIRWPKEKLYIQVLDDSTDETVEKVSKIVKKMQDDGYRIELIHRNNRVGFKAGALKEGLEKIKAEYVAIFDADFIPNPDFFVKLIPYFQDPEIGMIQTRWGHINKNFSLLTYAQSLGIDGHFVIEQVARNGSGLWMNFNGTAGIWRKQCIIDAGSWESDTLTEDFDLSYRAELKGWKFRYFSDIVNDAELPVTIQAFKSQQFRWCKGSIQTAIKLIPRIIKANLPWKIKIEAIIHLTNYLVHPLMILNILLTLPLIHIEKWSNYKFSNLATEFVLFIAFLLSISTFAPTIFYLYTQKELHQNWKKKIPYMFVLMMIGIGISVSNTKAFLEAIFGKISNFQRTPKYKIETKNDNYINRSKYKQNIDPTILVEFLFFIYCLLTIWFAYSYEKYLVIPFMFIYAIGFFYVMFLNIYQQIIIKTSFFIKN
ncbi:MAG: glycosyltransferase family 2 protein [Leptospiraceae bacterium]|nr:glycosyltransferase family 2 protein [Leptospiraceae bacterium]MDW7975540.1 glycosyltransferase family 2 protein [Leptospiraceae bacterium]